MMRRNLSYVLVAAVAGLMVTGCMPEMTIEQMKEMRPERPPELDRLNMFAGKWTSTGEAEMAGLDEVHTWTGSSESTWGCDGWCLVEHSTGEMGELGNMAGMGVWTWDAKSKKYRSTWADNWGSTGQGVGKYDEETRTWTIKAKSRGAMGKSIGKGTVTFVDDDTMEWSWTERAGLFGMFKVMEAKGTGERQ